MSALVRVASWVVGLCLLGALLFLAVQRNVVVEPAQPISAARFSIGAPSWLASNFEALQPLDGEYDSTVESLTGALDTTGMQPGVYTIFLEAQDADGNWGPPSAVSIEVVVPATKRTPPQYKLYLPRVWR